MTTAPTDQLAGFADFFALDLRRKVALLTGASFFAFTGDPAAGIPGLAMSDGPLGVRAGTQTGGDPAALLPCGSLLGATWDVDLLEEVGALLASEAHRSGTRVLLGPTVNLQRSPLGGRVFETYSEDPLLTGLLGAGYVRGCQRDGVAACLKHLVANDAETDRFTVDVRMDEATLREVYLLPFEIAHADAGVGLVMAAYNGVNGSPMTRHHHILQEILKDEWGFEGAVVSDFFAADATDETILGGLDMVLPGPFGPWGEQLVRAVEEGRVPESRVDDAVRRLLHVHALADDAADRPVPAADAPERRGALTRIAAAGMTVLTNNGVLPLTSSPRVALIGVPARETLVMGGGSAELTAPHRISILAGLEAVLPGLVVGAGGVEIAPVPPAAEPSFLVDPVDGSAGLRLEILDADGTVVSERHVPDSRLILGWEGELDQPGRSARLTARIAHDGPLQLGVQGIGRWTVRLGDDAAMTSFAVDPVTGQPGEALLAPSCHVLDVAVSGPTAVEAVIAFGDQPHGYPGLIARPAPLTDDQAIAAAVAAARVADVAVVVVGTTAHDETESKDRSTMTLPGAQDALVAAVAAVAHGTVVVVNAAAPVLMPWADQVDAIVVVGLPGQEGGHAVAAVLTGTLEPAGRLAMTWPAADGASPGWQVAPVDGALEYSEGPFVGHRGHAAGLSPAPRFWFGAGEGYGCWEYTDGARDDRGATPEVSVTVGNVGRRTSREVVQVYLLPADTTRPTRLVGWAAVVVEPDATARVTVTCDPRSLRRWDAAADRWSAHPERGELLIARGLGDVRVRLPLG